MMHRTEITAPSMFGIPQVIGLQPDQQEALGELVAQWVSKMPRNIERMLYLDGKNKLKDLRIALPPQLVGQLEIVMGWPEKAVYELANRIVLDRITDVDGASDPFDLNRVLFDNRFDVELPMATASSLAQSCAFMSTTPGGDGDPDALVMFHSALWATGIWDRRRRALKSALLINDTDGLGQPTRMTMFLPAETVVCVKGAGWYVEDAIPHRLGRVPMEVIPFRPTLDRPFGRARVDRRVISLTDRALRAGARLEVHSELFSAMKLILLGASEDTFTDDTGKPVPLWSFYMGRLNTLSKDEDGDVPELEQIKAESPEPHIAVMRQLASEFSGHTGVPLGSLGIATDNPESAQSKTVAREDIVADAEKQQTIMTAVLRRGLENVLMIRDGLSERPDGVLDLQFIWRRPDRPTLAAVADSGAKQVGSIQGLAQTTVGMELLGLRPDQIDRAQSELRRTRAASTLDRLQAARTSTEDIPAAGGG
ncbi:phage portal protein [Microbacterium sp.]|uniref:phage portal protein n=1 Tax=Microbacterium sp. TaxID=51671 RepID=UPI003A92F655